MSETVIELLVDLNLLMAYQSNKRSVGREVIEQILARHQTEEQSKSGPPQRLESAIAKIEYKIDIRRKFKRNLEDQSFRVEKFNSETKTPDITKERMIALENYTKWSNQHEERFANPQKSLNRNSISFGGEITFEEDLPLPWVKYPPYGGIACTFSKSENGPFIGCQCSKIALDNKLMLLKRELNSHKNGIRPGRVFSDFWNWTVNEEFSYNSDEAILDLGSFAFAKKICHQCRGILPLRKTSQYTYRDQPDMYGNTKHFGPWETYLLQEYLKAGLEFQRIWTSEISKDLNDPELSKLVHAASDLRQSERYRSSYRSQIGQIIENRVRKSFNLPEYGQGSRGELELFILVKRIFTQSTIFRNFRPHWLYGLELDIWIPEESLAFEYQGQQHSTSIEHWGGKEALEKTKERDMRKKKLCQANGVNLICVNYDDPLEETFVLKKIDSAR